MQVGSKAKSPAAVDAEAPRIVAQRIIALFDQLRRDDKPLAANGASRLAPLGTPDATALEEQLEHFQAMVQALAEERDRLVATQAEIMSLLRCSSPDWIVHDLRNVLNQVAILKIRVAKIAAEA